MEAGLVGAAAGPEAAAVGRQGDAVTGQQHGLLAPGGGGEAGHLGDQSGTADAKTAMPAFEHVLQPHATSPEDWQWRRTDLDLCSYTTRDLAAQCVASVVGRLPAEAENRLTEVP